MNYRILSAVALSVVVVLAGCTGGTPASDGPTPDRTTTQAGTQTATPTPTPAPGVAPPACDATYTPGLLETPPPGTVVGPGLSEIRFEGGQVSGDELLTLHEAGLERAGSYTFEYGFTQDNRMIPGPISLDEGQSRLSHRSTAQSGGRSTVDVRAERANVTTALLIGGSDFTEGRNPFGGSIPASLREDFPDLDLASCVTSIEKVDEWVDGNDVDAREVLRATVDGVRVSDSYPIASGRIERFDDVPQIGRGILTTFAEMPVVAAGTETYNGQTVYRYELSDPTFVSDSGEGEVNVSFGHLLIGTDGIVRYAELGVTATFPTLVSEGLFEYFERSETLRASWTAIGSTVVEPPGWVDSD